MFTGVQRYIANTFTDLAKNECIKILLGHHQSQRQYGVKAKMQKVMKERLSSI